MLHNDAQSSILRYTCTLQVRDWIAESLYSLERGYFNTCASPVGQLSTPFPFQQLTGQQAYLQNLRSWYDKLQVWQAI